MFSLFWHVMGKRSDFRRCFGKHGKRSDFHCLALENEVVYMVLWCRVLCDPAMPHMRLCVCICFQSQIWTGWHVWLLGFAYFLGMDPHDFVVVLASMGHVVIFTV